ncbi:putative A/G-specific adenine glycosylase [Selenomonas sp. FOBRC9]|uniref:A/G-specific adenine glycosylase n=1 Tax=Selenomonas sp. FOBRC9 TaxID=936573 RepID=UPI00027A545F|nr:A/G-specific adenine glycosylase [Selenomonas sp. FOBRC9]EJP33587.1 putative A/G-specific adenine glycosylase [Selenomonas sp. FOBRC9]
MNIPAWEGSSIFPALCDTLLTWRKSSPDTRELPWRDEPTPYHIWISEIMLQQTRANVVRGYYLRFLAALPTVCDLADVDEDALMKLWQGLGYYSRARNLRRAAQAIVERHGGALPDDFDALLALPGIGRYTASAISSFAYGRPCPAVDGNFLRVAARVTANPIDIAKDASKRALEEALRPSYPIGKDAGLLNEAFMDLGATVCLPNGVPLCRICPAARLCLAHDRGAELDYPVKSALKARRKEHRTVLLLRCGDRCAIRKRPAKGLLAGLWEYPNLEGKWGKRKVLEHLAAEGFTVRSIAPLPPARHVFTHIEWNLTGWEVYVEETNAAPLCAAADDAPSVLLWVRREDLADTYGIPAAFGYFTPR